MKKILIFATLLIISVFSTQESGADEAGSLLRELAEDSRDDIKEAFGDLQKQKKLHFTNIRSWRESLTDQRKECRLKKKALLKADQEQQANVEFTGWISDKIKELLAKYDKLYNDRCKANRNYIEGLKNDKILLRLIEFLRSALEAKDNMNFLQKQEFTKTFTQFLSLYRSNNTKSLLKLHSYLDSQAPKKGTDDKPDASDFKIDNKFDTKQRSKEEVGEGHVDGERENVELDSFKSGDRKDFAHYKKQLLDLLTEFEATIKAKLIITQENEVEGGIKTAEFRLKIEKELQELDAELYIQVTKSTPLLRRVQETSAASESCKAQLKSVRASFIGAILDWRVAYKKLRTKFRAAVGDFKTMKEVVKIYYKSMDKEYRESLDDHIEDGVFDDDVAERELDEFESIKDDAGDDL